MSKSVILKCKIGTLDISNTSAGMTSVESLSVNRNFSDVADKFSMTLVDTPVSNDRHTDLELYMNGGGRAIEIWYGDDVNKLLHFKGTIWDYKNTFVGDIKKLEITGYITKSDYVQNESGTTWTYNIDWNNYFNLRSDTSKPWNVLMQSERYSQLATCYTRYRNLLATTDNTQKYNADTGKFSYKTITFSASDSDPVQMSDVLDSVFHDMFTYNSTFIKVKGPVGTINLPVPDSFVSSQDTTVIGKDSDSGSSVNFVQQACALYWDDPHPTYWLWHTQTGWEQVDESSISGLDLVFIAVNYAHTTSQRPIVGFINKDGSYVQVNLKKNYAGAGIQIKNKFGVSPSDIVKQLAKLEGWKIGNIVDTELITNSDSLVMKGQSALEFIYNNLVPLSIMPSGVVTRQDGTTQIISAGTGGFVPYFKNGKFYYEPLNSSHLVDRRLDDLYLGYNIKNSPVISFQVDTKGTTFYTVQPVKVSAMSILTGIEDAQVSTTSSAAITNFNKVAGHNEGLDAFLGYNYSEILVNEDLAKANASAIEAISNMWDPSDSETNVTKIKGDTNPYMNDVDLTGMSPYQDVTDYILDNPQTILNTNIFSNNLTSTLNISAVESSTEIKSKLVAAKEKIASYMVKATMTMWGNTKIAPASLISITNMVKSTNKNYPSKHPTSGDYLIQSQTDQIDGSGFIQTLNMYRYTANVESSLNSTKIDWSKGIQPYQIDLKVSVEKDNAHASSDIASDNYQSPPSGFYKIGIWSDDKSSGNNTSVGREVYTDGNGMYFIIGIGYVDSTTTEGFSAWLNEYRNEGNNANNMFDPVSNGLYGQNFNKLGFKGCKLYYQIATYGDDSGAYGRVYLVPENTNAADLQLNPPPAAERLKLPGGAMTDLYVLRIDRTTENVLGYTKFWRKNIGWLDYSYSENC